MAFRRFAKALTSQRDIPFDRWMEEMREQASDSIPEQQVVRTAKQVLNRCDPKKYLLSHATIVASVDTYAPQGSVTGRRMDDNGLEIDVKFSNFRIKPECQEIINNNGDAWERSLLMSTYKTFVGAPNYLEHIQLPALSKGFIVDAIARDIGHSCYIDILVATDRQHNQLVNDILSGEMQAMSMGCISLFTICTKCGNVAADDSQLCSHVLYDGKLSCWVDEQGQEHRLGELIGHVTVPNSNQFIEASWVRNPAFKGAVRRNLLNADQIVGSPLFATRLDESSSVHSIRSGMEFDVPVRNASTRRALDEEPVEDETAGPPDPDPDPVDEDPDLGSEEPDVEETGSEPESNSDTIHGLVEQIKKQVLESIVEDLGKELSPTAEDVGVAAPPSDLGSYNLNDTLVGTKNFKKDLNVRFKGHPNLVQWASKIYDGLHAKPKQTFSSLTSKDLIIFSWITDVVSNKDCSPDLYKLAIEVGPMKNYPSPKSFMAACGLKVNRSLTLQEKGFLATKGRIASLSTKF